MAGTVGRNHIIERPRLTRLLDETPARVIMLVAPAGYGKTTLARQWLATRTHAWYQAGAASSDVAAFALGIAGAASTLCPGAGQRLREWLPTSSDPENEVDVIVELLDADLERWPEDAWFVIDDYNNLATSKAPDLLTKCLFVDAGRRLFLTSRRRPSWWTARKLLYGQVLELGQTALAMTSEEATGVLANQTLAVSGLVALAEGWPAVIGLAALTNTPVESAELPEALYEYFAEEVFAILPEKCKSDVSRLALLPMLDRAGAESLLDAQASEALAAAKEAGLLATTGQPEGFHPLLRAFLLHKLTELPPGQLREAVNTAVAHLMATRDWDSAFGLIREFQRIDLLDELLIQALRALLHQSRFATLRDWILFATEQGHRSPMTDLVEAEVLYRRGLYGQAEILARAAATSLDDGHPLQSAAYFRAGQCSYLVDEPKRALSYSRAARTSAQTALDVQNALWSEFNALAELEDDEALQTLREFAAVAPDDRPTIVRYATGRLVIAVREGGLDEAVIQAEPVRAILGDVADPTIRSSFCHIYAVALRLQGRYAEALSATDDAEQVLRESGTSFALPHVLINRVAALTGLRRFTDASAVLSEVETRATETRDHYVLANAAMFRSRLLLHQRDATAAAALLRGPLEPQLSSSMKAELLMTLGLALAGAGEFEEGLDLVRTHRSLSKYVEPSLLAEWVRALCSASTRKPDHERRVRRAYVSTQAEGAFDVFVLAYRVAPQLLNIIARDEKTRETLRHVIMRAQDNELLGTEARADLGIPRKPDSEESQLTPREKEVYRLLASGKTNREIASVLVISELTVKVHVRHILSKLGVRTRTQAAVHALRPRD